MSIYTVTFCATDQEVDSNPFWHTCLLLSRFDELTKKMEVVENWGFGGVPANSPYSFIRQIKHNLGLDTDFYGNHGMLYPEKMRYLERGCGLHGVTFELTEAKFKVLQEKCHQMEQDQNDAINDAVRDLNLKPASGRVRNYQYEHESQRIYQHELKKAQDEQRSPRLHEFSLFFWMGAHTCKAQILKLLYGVITPEQYQRIMGWHLAVPRLSGTMENIYLHSTGPLSQHQKRSGQMAHYRKAADAKLYWTLAPQEVETLSQDTYHLFKIHAEHCEEVKHIIRQLQKLEWFFRDAILADVFTVHRNNLIEKIVRLYESFATLEPKKSQVAKNDWSSFWRWMASQPRDVDEKILIDKMNQAKGFIHSLYMAVVDNWDLDTISQDPEALVQCLNEGQQKELCELIGRAFIKPEKDFKPAPDYDESLEYASKMLSP